MSITRFQGASVYVSSAGLHHGMAIAIGAHAGVALQVVRGVASRGHAPAYQQLVLAELPDFVVALL